MVVLLKVGISLKFGFMILVGHFTALQRNTVPYLFILEIRTLAVRLQRRLVIHKEFTKRDGHLSCRMDNRRNENMSE